MSSFTATDVRYMARALQLARKGLFSTDPNPRVGCVLVRDDQIIAEGWHERAGQGHAEANALAQAGSKARGASCYVTLEPCSHTGRTPPCADSLINAGISRVIAASADPNPKVAGQGFARLQAAGIALEYGLLEHEARALNPGFMNRFTRQRPWFRCKLAMSLDGRTALALGESQWITDAPARADVQALRARSSAILTGVNTILADDPSLNVRLEQAWRQPLRIVLDPALRTPPTARTLQLPGDVLILTAVSDSKRWQALQQAGAEVHCLPASSDGLDLVAVAQELARRELNEIHLECGPTLAGALLNAELLDELVLYVAPVLLGDAARGLFQLPALTSMSQRIELELADIRAVGRDWRITAYPKRQH